MHLEGNRVQMCVLAYSGLWCNKVWGFCEHGNEHSGYIKGEECLD